MKVFVFKMSRERALELDLIWCKCGHRPNNHFDFKNRPCAHCDCQAQEETTVKGVEMQSEEW